MGALARAVRLRDLGSFLACSSTMLVGFLVDLVHAPVSPQNCGDTAGLVALMLLHLKFLPFMHAAMAAGLFEPSLGARPIWARRVGRLLAMSVGMALGGAMLMRTSSSGQFGWWPMYGAMLAGMAAGQALWTATRPFDGQGSCKAPV